MKKKSLLTWIDQKNGRLDCREYLFKILPTSSYQVKRFELYDNDKRVDGTFYAQINAQLAAKAIYKKKLKSGEIKPYVEPEVKKISPTSGILNHSIIDSNSWVSGLQIERLVMDNSSEVQFHIDSAAPISETQDSVQTAPPSSITVNPAAMQMYTVPESMREEEAPSYYFDDGEESEPESDF
jgi:hypothetical protein